MPATPFGSCGVIRTGKRVPSSSASVPIATASSGFRATYEFVDNSKTAGAYRDNSSELKMWYNGIDEPLPAPNLKRSWNVAVKIRLAGAGVYQPHADYRRFVMFQRFPIDTYSQPESSSILGAQKKGINDDGGCFGVPSIENDSGESGSSGGFGSSTVTFASIAVRPL